MSWLSTPINYGAPNEDNPIYTMIRCLLTVLFLILPALGLYTAASGLITGPNYFADKQITLDSVNRHTKISSSARGLVYEDEVVKYQYHFTTRKGQVIRGVGSDYVHNLPDGNSLHFYKGNTLWMRVPVPESEGEFGINRAVEQGLTVFAFYAILAAVSIYQVRKRFPK